MPNLFKTLPRLARTGLLAMLLLLPFFFATAQEKKAPLYFRSFDGTRIHYADTGRGKPVLLLHGFLNTLKSWQAAPLYNDLVKAGFRVIAVDLRGNGLSDKPHDLAAYTQNAEVKDVMALMQHLGLKSYDVVGYSRGSILLARQLVMDKRVHAAVIGGMGTAFTDPNWPRRKMFAEAFSGKAHLYPDAQGAVAYAKTINADTVALGLQQKAQPSTPKTALAKVKLPVLVIIGTEDTDPDSGADLAKIFPHATYATVPGDHNHASRTQEFSDKVIAFLKAN
ncbi:MAG: alpha/beta fold hydrolase [Mucilaginibacter polytrichastri]|nr:alpha/beta fold hydrolase [Mucilaginibacter polytrichastri]